MLYTERQLIRFTKYVEVTKGCWLWRGSRNAQGYGRFQVSTRKPIQAHRFAFQVWHGDIPQDADVCHACDNPSCVNPAHLWAGTRAQNMQDSISKGRFKRALGTKHGLSRFNEADIRLMRGLHARGFSYQHLADLFDCSKASVADIVKKRWWRHV